MFSIFRRPIFNRNNIRYFASRASTTPKVAPTPSSSSFSTPPTIPSDVQRQSTMTNKNASTNVNATPSTTTTTTQAATAGGVTTTAATTAATTSSPTTSVAPKCECLKDAIMLVVTKEGPTKGRGFWVCPDSQKARDANYNVPGLGCRFFQWASSNTGNDTVTIPNPAVDIQHEDVLCKCGEPSVSLSVKKQGVNFGRRFRRCAKGLFGQSSGEPCDFFEWAEKPTHSAGDGPLCRCNQPSVLLRVSKQGPNVRSRFSRLYKINSDFIPPIVDDDQIPRRRSSASCFIAARWTNASISVGSTTSDAIKTIDVDQSVARYQRLECRHR